MRRALLASLTLSCLLVAASAAQAARVSSNWAGYVVRGHVASTRFERVVGSWTQPSATCSVGHPTYSAFWVGLGGYSSSSQRLEQTGTESDCSTTGHASYSAWFELVPNPPVAVKLTVKPGDVIAASVTVNSSGALLHLRDVTSGRLFSKRARPTVPDTTSAEWIAEAPSACDRSGCRTLPLTDFGAVTFANATAQTTSGVVGPISDSAFSRIPIELEGDLEAFSAASGPAFAGATPGALSSAGGAFSVTWQRTGAPAPSSPGSIGPITQQRDLSARLDSPQGVRVALAAEPAGARVR